MALLVALLAERCEVRQAVVAALAQRSQVVNVKSASGSLAILAGVLITNEGSFPNEAPARAPGCPATMSRAEAVLRVLGSEEVIAVRVRAFDLGCLCLLCHSTIPPLCFGVDMKAAYFSCFGSTLLGSPLANHSHSALLLLGVPSLAA